MSKRRTYAAGTSVSTEKSKGEIERTLERYGAAAFGYGVRDGKAVIGFQAGERNIRFTLPLPALKDFEQDARGHKRSKVAAEKSLDQERRRIWRSMNIAIKAKLEMVDTGISTFEIEFQPYMVLPNGKTVGETMIGYIEKAYSSGKMPRLLEVLDG